MARIFAGVAPTAHQSGGAATRNLGTKFTTAISGTWAGWHVYKTATSPPTTYRLGLWNGAGTLLDDVTVSAASLSTGDNLVGPAAVGVTLTSGAGPYTVGMFISGGGPDFEDAPGTLTSARTVGNLTAVASGAMFRNTAIFEQPDGTWTGYFFLDPEVTFPGMPVAPTGVAVPVAAGLPTLTQAFTAFPGGVAVPVTVGTPTASQALTVAPGGVAVPLALGSPTLTLPGAAAAGISVPVAVGTPTLTWSATVSPTGIAVPVTTGEPSTRIPGMRILRLDTGSVARPDDGPVLRPDDGTVARQ